MNRSLHPVASLGYAVASDDYERARPDYPPEALEVLRDELRLGPASVIIELGAGTGKLTRLLTPAMGRVVATEPVEAMRARLAATVRGPVVAAAAEAVPMAAGCADAVVAATAFHWFRHKEALAEIHRVLRRGGGLGLLWNNPDRTVDWVRAAWTIVDEHRGDTPGNRDRRWQEAFVSSAGFTPLSSHRFTHSVDVDLEALLARVASISFIASLPAADRAAVLGRIRAVWASHPEIAGRERLQLPNQTEVYCCHRNPAGG